MDPHASPVVSCDRPASQDSARRENDGWSTRKHGFTKGVKLEVVFFIMIGSAAFLITGPLMWSGAEVLLTIVLAARAAVDDVTMILAVWRSIVHCLVAPLHPMT